MRVRILPSLFLALLLFSAAGAADWPPAADFSLPDLSGHQVKLSSFRGQVVLLNFWASWCPPCRSEMPSLQKLNDRLKGKKFVILAAAQDQDPKKSSDFIKANRYSFPVLLDPQNKAARQYGVTAYPTTYLIDKKGKLRLREVGSRDWSDQSVIDQIVQLVKEK